MGVFLWVFLKIFICLNKANIMREGKSRDGHAIKQLQNKYSDVTGWYQRMGRQKGQS
jgi:hypothetical protein